MHCLLQFGILVQSSHNHVLRKSKSYMLYSISKTLIFERSWSHAQSHSTTIELKSQAKISGLIIHVWFVSIYCRVDFNTNTFCHRFFIIFFKTCIVDYDLKIKKKKHTTLITRCSKVQWFFWSSLDFETTVI